MRPEDLARAVLKQGPMTTFARLALGVSAVLLASSLAAGCQQTGCAASAVPSDARLTLHLPPEKDVAMPETVKVCQQPKCLSAFVPPLAGPGMVATFTFPSSTAAGTIVAGPGGVRRLDIAWPIEMEGVFNPKDPRNEYDVTVVDVNGVQTGALSTEVKYDHIVDSACGVDVWTGAASD
jgi:hypothetical protein